MLDKHASLVQAWRPLTQGCLCLHDVSHCNVIIFESANCKVQIEDFIFQLFSQAGQKVVFCLLSFDCMHYSTVQLQDLNIFTDSLLLIILFV